VPQPAVNPVQVADKRFGAVTIGVSRCPNCEMHYALYRNVQGDILWWEPRTSQPERPEGIPLSILDDYVEGQNALGFGLHKSAALMFRRVVQAAAFDKGAPDKKLQEQVDWLAENQKITPDMRDWAHELRLFGNAGGHPG